MRCKVCFMVAACFLVAAAALVMSVSGGSTSQADEPKAEKVAALQKAVADSKMPDDIKKFAAAAKNPTYGKVYYLWPMSNGTFLFGISTPKGGVAFTFKTGDLTADAMVKVLLMAYEKQTPVYVFEAPATPQVASSVVTVTP